MESYMRLKLLEIEEDSYKIGFIDGKKIAARNILEIISPIVTKDCLRDIIKMIRKIEIKEKPNEEINEIKEVSI